MRRLLEKMRSILATSAVGGVLGSLFGAAMMGFGALVSSGEVTAALFVAAVGLSGTAGAFIGGAFGGLLALSKRQSLDELGYAKTALFGALAGAAFPLAAALLTGGWLVPLLPSQLLLLGGVFGAVGAGLSTGLVGVAKSADSSTLEEALATGQTACAPAEFQSARSRVSRGGVRHEDS